METHTFQYGEMTRLLVPHLMAWTYVRNPLMDDALEAKWHHFKSWFEERTGCEVEYDFDPDGKREFIVTAPSIIQFKLTYL